MKTKNRKFHPTTVATFLLALLPLIVNAQIAPPLVREAGMVGYPGDFTPTEIALEEYSKALSLDSLAAIKVEVTIHAVKDGKVRVNNLNGLPIPDSSGGRELDDVSITIPFHTKDFVSNGYFDEIAFSDHMDGQLARLAAKPKKQKNANDSRTMSVINQSNCGGYSEGTTLTITTSSCHLGNVTNTYQCMHNPTTGGNDWYVISSTWQSNVDCIDP